MSNLSQKLVRISFVLSIIALIINIINEGIVLFFYLYKEITGHSPLSYITAVSPFGIWANGSHFLGDRLGTIFARSLLLVHFLLILSIISILIASSRKEAPVPRFKFVLPFFLFIVFLFGPYISVSSPPHIDWRIKMKLESTRVAAELWYDDLEGGNYTYSNACNSSDFKKIKSAIEELKSTMRCFDGPEGYCAKANLVETDFAKEPGEWCADSTGYAGPEANCSAENIGCQ